MVNRNFCWNHFTDKSTEWGRTNTTPSSYFQRSFIHSFIIFWVSIKWIQFLTNYIKTGFKKSIEKLIEKGANVNAVDDSFNMTPLHFIAVVDSSRSKYPNWTDEDGLSKFPFSILLYLVSLNRVSFILAVWSKRTNQKICFSYNRIRRAIDKPWR